MTVRIPQSYRSPSCSDRSRCYLWLHRLGTKGKYARWFPMDNQDAFEPLVLHSSSIPTWERVRLRLVDVFLASDLRTVTSCAEIVSFASLHESPAARGNATWLLEGCLCGNQLICHSLSNIAFTIPFRCKRGNSARSPPFRRSTGYCPVTSALQLRRRTAIFFSHGRSMPHHGSISERQQWNSGSQTGYGSPYVYHHPETMTN